MSLDDLYVVDLINAGAYVARPLRTQRDAQDLFGLLHPSSQVPGQPRDRQSPFPSLIPPASNH